MLKVDQAVADASIGRDKRIREDQARDKYPDHCALESTQDKRAMKIGLDFGLNVGKKLNQNASVDAKSMQKKDEEGGRTRAFTVSK